jgi:hypothetical protein
MNPYEIGTNKMTPPAGVNYALIGRLSKVFYEWTQYEDLPAVMANSIHIYIV